MDTCTLLDDDAESYCMVTDVDSNDEEKVEPPTEPYSDDRIAQILARSQQVIKKCESAISQA